MPNFADLVTKAEEVKDRLKDQFLPERYENGIPNEIRSTTPNKVLSAVGGAGAFLGLGMLLLLGSVGLAVVPPSAILTVIGLVSWIGICCENENAQNLMALALGYGDWQDLEEACDSPDTCMENYVTLRDHLRKQAVGVENFYPSDVCRELAQACSKQVETLLFQERFQALLRYISPVTFKPARRPSDPGYTQINDLEAEPFLWRDKVECDRSPPEQRGCSLV